VHQDDFNSLLTIDFQLDPSYIQIERKVYSFMDATGQIGGVVGLIYPLGIILSALFSKLIYTITMLSILYKTNYSQELNKKSNKVFPAMLVRSKTPKLKLQLPDMVRYLLIIEYLRKKEGTWSRIRRREKWRFSHKKSFEKHV
jgi:hypothetical protein